MTPSDLPNLASTTQFLCHSTQELAQLAQTIPSASIPSVQVREAAHEENVLYEFGQVTDKQALLESDTILPLNPYAILARRTRQLALAAREGPIDLKESLSVLERMATLLEDPTNLQDYLKRTRQEEETLRQEIDLVKRRVLEDRSLSSRSVTHMEECIIKEEAELDRLEIQIRKLRSHLTPRS